MAKQAGWKIVPEDTTDHAFTGDAVLSNNRLAVVFRRGGPGAEVYGRGNKVARCGRCSRQPATRRTRCWRRWRSPITRAAEATIDATFKSAGGKDQHRAL